MSQLPKPKSEFTAVGKIIVKKTIKAKIINQELIFLYQSKVSSRPSCILNLGS